MPSTKHTAKTVFSDILMNGEPNHYNKNVCETIFVCHFWMCLILANRKSVNIGMLNSLNAAVGLKLWHSHCFVAYLACQTQRLIHRLIEVAKILDKKSTWTFSLQVLERTTLGNETFGLPSHIWTKLWPPFWEVPCSQCIAAFSTVSESCGSQWEARWVYSVIIGHKSWISRKIHEGSSAWDLEYSPVH